MPMNRLVRLKQNLIDPTVEPVVITGGLYALTVLYYTRRLPFQILSLLVLIAVTVYWSYSIRHGPGISLRDLKLTTKKLWLDIILAIGLVILGLSYYTVYLIVTRGHPLKLGYGGSVTAILTILAVASAEELFFRGYLQNRLSGRYSLWRRVFFAAIALSLYKNVVHLWNGMPLVLHIELLLMGLVHNVVLSLWMERSDSLVGPLLSHIIWDILIYGPMASIPYWVI